MAALPANGSSPSSLNLLLLLFGWDPHCAGPIQPMRRALEVTIGSTLLLYFAVAVTGYAALGNATPPNILTGPNGAGWQKSQVPHWVSACMHT